MALPTKEEHVLLESFRGRVADILTEDEAMDDMFLVRWLRARELDMDKAETMLRNAIKWRKENRLDEEIIPKPLDPFFSENYPRWVDGMDKDGRPVFCCHIGKWDVRKALKQRSSVEFIMYLTQGFEEISRAIKRAAEMRPPQPDQPPVSQIICIYDWEGFAWSQLFSFQTVQNFLQMGSIYEAYYPEILHTCYFVNTPALISSVLTLLRPVIAPKTMDKIKCLGQDKENWKHDILKVIEADQIRPQFGGTKENNKNPFL